MEVRPATKGDVTVLAQVLARAFDDDPVTSFLFPKQTRRPRALFKFFSIALGSLFMPFGAIWTSADRDGVAIWAPPGSHRPRPRDAIRVVAMLPYVIGHPVRVASALAALEAKHPREPHYYLATLGTDPPMQGKGIGSAVLKPVLDICDREGIPAYLESSKERNVPFYRRHGFEVTEEYRLPPDGPPVWLMWREPRAGSGDSGEDRTTA